LIAEAVDRYERTGARQLIPFARAAEAECWLKLEKPVEAINAIDRALSLIEETGVRLYQAELLRLRACARYQLMDRRGDDDLDSSLEIARVQGARSFFLRGAANRSSRGHGPGHSGG
jgi:hypothetical protein